MASYVDDSTAALSEKFGEVQGLSSVNDLLRRCIVTKKKLVTISTAADLIVEVDRILRDESRAPGYLIFSFLDADRNSPIQTESTPDQSGDFRPVAGLHGIRIFLPSSKGRFKALARIRSNAPTTIQFRIGDGLSQRLDIPSSGGQRIWTDPISMTKSLGAGLHELTVTGLGIGTEISAFMVYTE